MTDELQAMDQLINKKMKNSLKLSFNNWYSELVIDWINKGNDPDEFSADLRWSVLKPIQTKWIVSAYNNLTEYDVTESFTMCGIGPAENEII